MSILEYMDGPEEMQIIFKQEEYGEFEEQKDDKRDEEWPDLYDEIIKALETPEPETIEIEESKSIEEKRSDKTIVTVSSDESCSSSSSGRSAKSVESHPCLTHLSVSDSQLKFLDIYNFYPIPKDPGINEGFWILYPHSTCYDPDGVDKFFDLTKSLGATPITSMREQLRSEEVNLRHYCVDEVVVRAICEALIDNVTVKSLDLQDSVLSEDACYYLNKLLMRNNALRSLNLRFCRLGVNGARRLEEGISLSSALAELNLSRCELGAEGFERVAKAVAANTLLECLDVSSNDLGEEAAVSLQEMLVLNDSLKRLNLSWNFLNTKIAAEKMFNGLSKNSSLVDVNLSWNSMSRSCVFHLAKYIVKSKTVQILNVEANRFADDDAPSIARALVQNRSLKEFHFGKNPIGPKGVSNFVNQLSSNRFIDSPLLLLNLDSYWVDRDVLPVLDGLKEEKPNLNVKLAGILRNYQIVGPDLRELYFKIANYEAMLPKKKKDKKNFGHFVLLLPDSNITKDDFLEHVSNSKIKVSESLVKEIMKQFMVTKKKLSQAALKESYMTYFPDTRLPPPRPPKTEKTEETKKGKKSKSKKKGSSKKKKDKGKKKKK